MLTRYESNGVDKCACGTHIIPYGEEVMFYQGSKYCRTCFRMMIVWGEVVL